MTLSTCYSTILILILTALVAPFGDAGPNPELRKLVLKGYDKVGIPGDGSSAVVVEIPTLTLTSISLNEKEQSIAVSAWLHMTWEDSRLSWGTFAKGSSDGFLHFAHDEVWTPDVAVFNVLEPTKSLDFFGKSQVLTLQNGTVVWVPPVKIESLCELDLLRWPYDTQTCKIALGSWTYSESEVNVTLGEDEEKETLIVMDENLLNNVEWKITEPKATRMSKEYPCCPGAKYVSLHYEFTLQRKSCTYFYTVILPILLITLINIVIFLLPKTKGEKLTLGIFNFLIVSLYLLNFSSKLPVLVHTPLIVVLYGANLFFISIIIAVSSLVLNFTDGTHTRGTPKWSHWIYNRTVASLLCLRSLQKVTNAKRDGRSYSFKSGTAGNGSVAVEDPILIEQPKPHKETDGGNRAEWLYLAAFIDRIGLILYLTVSIVLFVYVHL